MCFINTSCTIHSADADADLPAVPRSKIMGHSSHRFEDLLGFSCCTEDGLSPRPFNDVGLPQWLGKSYILLLLYIYQVWLYIICDFQFISRTLSWRQLVLAALTASTSSPGPRHSHPAGLLPQQYNPHNVGRLATWCRAIWSVKHRVICMGTQYWIER
jgi:hypothetical protein